MKKSLILGALLAAIGLFSAPRVVAQGDVQYDSATGTPAWTISDQNGVLVPINSPIKAELWWAAGSAQPAASLAAVGVNGQASGADWFGGGQFFKGVVTIAGATAGQAITLQVRAWDPSSGATWDTATIRGQNPGTANYTTPTGINVPDPINGLASFQLVGGVIPEPSTFALIGLGTGALLFFRRRK